MKRLSNPRRMWAAVCHAQRAIEFSQKYSGTHLDVEPILAAAAKSLAYVAEEMKPVKAVKLKGPRKRFNASIVAEVR